MSESLSIQESNNEGQRLIQLLDRLSAFTTEDELTSEQFLTTISEAFTLICVDKNAHLKSGQLAEIVALLRNLLTVVIKNQEAKAAPFLTNIAEQNLLHHLFQLFTLYSEHLYNCLINNQLVEETAVLLLLRILQILHNLLNLHFFMRESQVTQDFESKYLAIFDVKHLR